MVDKNSIFGGMLTTLGAAKKTNCDALGIPWEPRYMLIGDAGGADPVPSPTQTKLVNQVYRAQLNQLRVSPTDANILIAELVLPPDVGGWWIRELALEDKDGVFCAVANAAPSYKPLLAQGSGRNQVVRMHIITSGTSNIQLKIDPSVVLATRQYVDETVNGLLPANKPAGTYTKVTVNDRGVFVSGSNPTTLAGFGITDTYTKPEIESMIAQASALPVGTMVGFPVNKLAPGFLELDGSVKSIAAYPDLAAFLGTAFNTGGEGAGNFRLPDSRGEFLRGWDHGRGVDVGRTIGSPQKGSLVALDTGTTGLQVMHFTGSPSVAGGQQAVGLDAYANADYPNLDIAGTTAQGTSVLPGLASEVSSGVVRPRNLAVMWCIKAWNAPINQGDIDIAALAASVEKLALNGPASGSKNLKVSTTGLSAVVTVSADHLVLSSVDGLTLRASNVALNIAGTSVGVNGIDAGVIAPSTWYSVWVISDGVTQAGLLSLSATAPAMPVGYTHKTRVDWIKTDGTANKYPLSHRKVGTRAQYVVGGNVPAMPSMAGGVAGSPAVPTYVPVAVSPFVPPTATSIYLGCYNNTNGGVIVAPNASYGGYTNTANPPPIMSFPPGTAGISNSISNFLLESSNVYWASGGAATNLFCNGWEDSQ